ncbi:hypothetical protein N9M80_01515 [Flavobacteriales bacterium]|nr:hypothetical protein [Flavobacteriales bacterium]
MTRGHTVYFRNGWLGLLWALVLPMLVASCQRNTAAKDPQSASNEAQVRSRASDPFDLLGARIEGDSMMLDVRYGGGCQEHVFDLDAGPMLKSLPPKQLLSIWHDAKGDNCRALFTKTIAFDLVPYRRSPHGITVIVLDGQELIYEYR